MYSYFLKLVHEMMWNQQSVSNVILLWIEFI